MLRLTNILQTFHLFPFVINDFWNTIRREAVDFWVGEVKAVRGYVKAKMNAWAAALSKSPRSHPFWICRKN